MKPEHYIAVFKRVAEKKGWKICPDKELLLSFDTRSGKALNECLSSPYRKKEKIFSLHCK